MLSLKNNTIFHIKVSCRFNFLPFLWSYPYHQFSNHDRDRLCYRI